MPKTMPLASACLCLCLALLWGKLPLSPDASVIAEARRLCAEDELEAAARLLGDALAARPASVPLRLERAALCTRLGFHSIAFRDYEAVLERVPECAEAWEGKARLRLRGLDIEGALADLSRALRAEPSARRRELFRRLRSILAKQRRTGC